MADRAQVGSLRMRELVLGLCTLWLLMENLLLLLWVAWQPLLGFRIATLTLLRVAIRAATPVTVLPGAGILDVAMSVAAGLGDLHV
jgi:hypothetical protein